MNINKVSSREVGLGGPMSVIIHSTVLQDSISPGRHRSKSVPSRLPRQKLLLDSSLCRGTHADFNH